jgi:hypothetical protein
MMRTAPRLLSDGPKKKFLFFFWAQPRRLPGPCRSSTCSRTGRTASIASRRVELAARYRSGYRVRGRSGETPWYDDRKMRELQARLLEEAAGKLAEQVVSKARQLAAPRS